MAELLGSLAKLETIGRQLAKITSVDEAVDLRSKAAAVEHYYRAQKNCKDIEQRVIVTRLRIERRLGELLSKTVKRGNPKSRVGRQIPPGVSRDQSSKFQSIARLPQKTFDSYLGGKGLLSTQGLVKLAAEAARRRAAARGPAAGGRVLTGDMSILHKHLEDESVSLIFTDPPYSPGALDTYGRLAELAAAKLAPSGLCLAYAGTMFIGDVIARMSEHLDYFWTFALVYKGGSSRILTRKVLQTWKPIVAFCRKGRRPQNQWVSDVVQGSGRSKVNHEWEQSVGEAAGLIEKLTEKPGDLVCDPFCGSGSILMAARSVKRDYIGCEIDATTAKGARRRLAAAEK